ncbi:MAG TPA: rhomboid family intramembrane serine protease [Solirubrobacteraceae bacterium]|nr:rhomboid family intramembrane serine protease [Solirubrobacteraceae bacterium]
MSPADLFVVCKNPDCGAEVSPYVTECPYCGTRLRKRAPKLDRGLRRVSETRRVPTPSLGRLRRGEIPGIRADRAPYATWAIVAGTCAVWVLTRAGYLDAANLYAVRPLGHEWWRVLTAPFAYWYPLGATGGYSGLASFASGVYQFATLFAVGLFGWLLERRHGSLAVLALFLVGACGGIYVALALDTATFALGANGGALALLCAWAVPDLLARRRRQAYDGDLLGTAVIGLLLLALPVALKSDEASAIAGAVGVAWGYLAGIALARRELR